MQPQGIAETLITQLLDERSPRSSDPNLEIQAYCKLAEEVVEFASDVLQEIAPLARNLCHAGSAGISLLETDPDGNPVIHWSVVTGALAPNQGLRMPRDESPCGLCTERRSPLLFARPGLVVPAFAELAVPVEEFLVVPLRERGERARGALWAAAHGADRKFDATDRLILQRLGHFTALALHMLDELKQREMLVHEMNHRVKNSLQLATSLLSLQAKRVAAPLQEELQIASQRIQSIARVHELLQQGQEYKTVALRPYLDSLCRELARMQQQPSEEPRPITLDLDEIELPTSQTIALGIIVTELVFNAMKHGARQGEQAEVAVRLHKSDDDVLHLAVDDKGDGLSPDFDLARNAGVGMQLVRAMTAQLHGSLRPVLDSQGTRFEITFPYRGSSA
jgi:two-component sensor histidine kinase